LLNIDFKDGGISRGKYLNGVKIKKLSGLLILIALFLSACGGGTNTGTPTDTNIDVNIFPLDFYPL